MLVLQPGCYQNMFITLLWATEAPKIAPFYDDRGIRISESGLMAHWEFTNPSFSLRICSLLSYQHILPPPQHTQLTSLYPDQLHELKYGVKGVIKWDKDTGNRWSSRYSAALNCLQSSAHVSRWALQSVTSPQLLRYCGAINGISLSIRLSFFQSYSSFQKSYVCNHTTQIVCYFRGDLMLQMELQILLLCMVNEEEQALIPRRIIGNQ